jgi:hypothetical protein
MNSQRFTCTDDDGTTKIVFIPHPISGPPPPLSQQSPRFDYQGPEGNFSFLGDQVGILESPLGSLITVTLFVGIAATVGITLALPPINMAGKKEQNFDTVAIKTEVSDVPKEGAALGYSVLLLRGVAEEIEPLP